MPTTIREMLVSSAVLAVICIAGCGRQPAEYGVAKSEISWTISTTNPVPGLDEASVTMVTLKAGPPGGLPFVVWSDLPNETSGQGEGSVHGAFYDGHHRAIDGRRVDFRAKSTDGKVGSITIAGVDYDFANGQLFLVSGHQDPVEVAQIRFDLNGFPKGDALKDLAKSNPQIRGFFEKHKKDDTNAK
jgi:hypothetical protein